MLPPSLYFQASRPLFSGNSKHNLEGTEEGSDAKKPRRSARLAIDSQRKAYGSEINRAVVQLKQGSSFSDSFRSRLRNPNDDALKQLVQFLQRFFPGDQRERLMERLGKRLPKAKGNMTDPALRFNIFRLPAEIQENILRHKLDQHPGIWRNTMASVFGHDSPKELTKREMRDLYLVTRHGDPLWAYSAIGSTVLTDSLRGLKQKSLFDYFMQFSSKMLPINQLDQYHLTALDTAVMTGMRPAVDVLLAKGDRVTKQTIKQAALWGEPEILEELLEKSDLRLTDEQVLKYRHRAISQREAIDTFISESEEERQQTFNQILEDYMTATSSQLPFDLTGLKLSVAALAKSGVNLDYVDDEWGYNMLHNAVGLNHASILTTLLRAGADVNKLNGMGGAPLYVAVQTQQPDAVRALLRMNAQVNVRNQRGETPLHMAAAKGNWEIFKTLLMSGGDIHAEDDLGENMLHYAAQSDSTDIVETALKAKVAVNQGGQFLYTPLAYAATNGHLPVVDLLLRHGADVDQEAQFGGTPIHRAAKAGRLDLVNRLIDAHASLDKRDSDGGTVLHCATESGNVELVNRLLALKLPVDAKAQDGSTPLHIAARRGDVPMIQALLEAGASIDKADRYGHSPLYRALWGPQPAAIEALLAAGANVNHWEKKDLGFGVLETPFLYALEHGDLAQVDSFLAAGGDVKIGEALVRAAKNPDYRVTERLLALHAPKDRKDGSGMNALHMAAFMGNLPVLQSLLKAGFSVKELDDHQGTALHWAAQGGSVEAVKTLLKAGAPVDRVNDQQETALHQAVKYRHPNLTTGALIDAGVPVNARDSRGHTALYYATKRHDAASAELLQVHGGIRE